MLWNFAKREVNNLMLSAVKINTMTIAMKDHDMKAEDNS